ncbi:MULTISPECIES: ABC transporter permease [unclassified Rhizobium]|uniref:ABC transporter permease n=1 Tax=unclassified Rhizobium TaxID=2613769 RepID=UPI00161E1F20|nr:MULTISPECIES: ABC transporter permease [unclassified Rhizobium]MBB3289371.1 peptide/nickel transport system permease protein [Rhizobium sp. BK252]MBB3404229.1 peptide/nickel transport system permease protein [Rhizobium sp. BK289]MBB3416698.1 peptide/nickel transport system permease protein [Rhizobium sp. BK284]MBB3484576.1 peptide/nickel transport system permease protein [Rhizobium sp. BK347]MDK4721153.1 ABC transporter permease [Rhizobium sp. CNPSo 3968]
MRIVRAIFGHMSGRIGGVIVLIYILLAILGTLGVTPHDPLMQNRIDRLHAPSLTYWMGTDLFGRDVASRLMHGIGESFTVAFFSVAVATLIGTVLGLTAAWSGKRWDGVIMRAMDVLLAFPAILLALLIIAIVGPGTWTSVAAIAIVYTPIFTRVVRGPALSLKARDFVDAARTFGSSRSYILTRHLLLNLVAPLTVQVTLALAWSLLTEAGLSFLGLGTQPPASSLGLMLSDSRNLMETAPWLLIFPGVTIMISILGFNLLGDALRDILDPKMRRSTV